MRKKEDQTYLDEEEIEKEEKMPQPTWKKPEPPPRFKYDESGFPIDDKQKKSK